MHALDQEAVRLPGQKLFSGGRKHLNVTSLDLKLVQSVLWSNETGRLVMYTDTLGECLRCEGKLDEDAKVRGS